MESGPPGEGGGEGQPTGGGQPPAGRIPLSEAARRLGLTEDRVRELASRLGVEVSPDNTIAEEDFYLIKDAAEHESGGGEVSNLTYVLSNLTPSSRVVADREKDIIQVVIPGKGLFKFKYNEETLSVLNRALEEVRSAAQASGQPPPRRPEAAITPMLARRRGEAEEEEEEAEEEEEERARSYVRGEIRQEPGELPTMSGPGSGKGPAGAGLPERASRRRGLSEEDIKLAYYNTAVTGKKVLIEDLMNVTLHNQKVITQVGLGILNYFIIHGMELDDEEAQRLFKSMYEPESLAAAIVSTVDMWRQDHIALMKGDVGELRRQINELQSTVNRLNEVIEDLRSQLSEARRELAKAEAFKRAALSVLTPRQAREVMTAVVAQALAVNHAGGGEGAEEE